MSTLILNLRAGLRLALSGRVKLSAFVVGTDQAVALLLLAFGLRAGFEFMTAEPVRTFSVPGLGQLAVNFLAFLGSAFLIARMQRRTDTVPAFLVMVLAAYPALFVVGAGYRWMYEAGTPVAPLLALSVFLGLLVWACLVVLRAVRRLYAVATGRGLVLTAVYAACNLPVVLMPPEPLWYGVDADDPYARFRGIDVEATYYAQYELLDAQLDALAPQRPGVTDLYFVGFGGYGWQDVFLREVRAVRELFDRRFDTRGRSMNLANNPATVNDTALANAYNLDYVLRSVAEIMDPEEDVLFLFLTSHGSDDHRLAVEFWPLGLNDLPAAVLGDVLRESGVRYRVVVVSACYSGGFVDALRDEAALVVTAAARDRQSFGCAHENDFTYFGRAFFHQQLRERYSFVDAFEGAVEAIRARELSEGLDPSEPQMDAGSAILPRLQVLEARLRGGAAEAVP